MKHIARRLVPFANNHKVINAEDITDPVLRRFALDETINRKIRAALEEIDKNLELLVPYQVDCKERQLKRYIQNNMGLVVNLSKLKKKHYKQYLKLYEYGSPPEVIKRWGLDYTYDRNIPKEKLQRVLEEYSEEGVVKGLYKNNRKLYMAILHQARKDSENVKTYVENLGYTYEQ